MQKQILDIKNCRKIAEFENMKTDNGFKSQFCMNN